MNGVTFCLVGIPPHTHTDEDEEDAKGQRDGVVSTNENKRRPLSSGEVEGLSWKGSRTVFLLKNSQGFGFTLRHFIVYPPDSSLHSLKDEENGNGKAARRRSCLEPMDTIFVKSVKEDGPAQHAGLCTGDRLVKVNGESILGKTYSQVISLIQNSEDILELSIMPKDDDMLQLVSAYSQDVYLRGNELKGEAPSHPDAPPLSYSSSKPSSSSPQPSHRFHSPLDNWQCRVPSASSPLDNRSTSAFSATSGWPGVPKDCSSHFVHSGQHRGRSTSAISALDFHFANHNAAIASATLPPLRKSSLPASARSHTEALCHQALSDWYYSQAEATERMSPRHRSISQDHLAEMGQGFTPSPVGPRTSSILSSEQRRRDTLLYHHHTTAASHDSSWLGGWRGQSGPGGGPCSETLRAAYAEYEHNYGRSVETLAQASALVPPRYEHPTQSPLSTKFTDETDQKASGGPNRTTMTPPIKPPCSVPSGPQSGQQVAEPQTRRIKDDELVGYRSFSPSFTRKANHDLQQTHSFREPGYRGVHLNRSPVSRVDIEDGNREVAPRPKSTPAMSTVTQEEGVRYVDDREAVSPVSLHQEVVLRQRPPPGRRRRTTTVELPDLSPGTPSPTPTGPTRRAHSSLAQHAFDSLSSIPFIGSIKGRRSSYLLAITTERSKSCDEGLNTFREEGRVFSKLPKRVKSFFMDGSLESLRAQEEARSKRHSTSDLGDITISDVRKEGWMHYKQILTEKGKKVGGGIRPWKRTFAVLCSHSLFLFKDKREAVLHGAGAGPGQEEHPPISIRGCLTDIAYSETKRKHTLRLTTQDFCEYLLQAEDRDDMLAWIRVIRENSKTDNEEIDFSRQALINKKLNDYRKHSLTGNKADSFPRAHRRMPPFILAKSDNSLLNRSSRCDDNKALWGINIMKKAKKTGSQKAFGVRLEDCQPAVNHKFVPLIVEMCCGVVEATGLEYTGIYRVPGNNAMVSHLQEHLNKGLDINTAEERWQDLNVISSLLKSFFRKLPEPLFTDDKYNYFIDANRIEDAELRLKTMKKLIHDLPNYYYHTLQFLVGHLKKVADSSEKNKMEPRNLALVFGPTLVRTSEDNMTDMVTHMPDRYKIVETLILHCDWFFNDGEFNKEDKTPEDKQDMQPVPNIDHLLSNIGRRGMPGQASDSTTTDSQKSRFSSGSKKDLNAKDFLTKSIISAVTRKRKKSPSSHQQGGSSTDEDSEHEPVKASNYEEGRREEGEEDGGDVKTERTASRREEHERLEASESAGGKTLEVKTGSRSSAPLQECRSSFTGYPPSHLRTLHPAKGRPSIPFWIRPTRPTSLYQSPSDWSAPVRYRKSRNGRTRAVSMNLELSLSDDQRPEVDPVMAVRVTEEELTPSQRGDLPLHTTDPLLCLDFQPLASSTLRWTDHTSSGSVVLRRTGQPPPDKRKAWRRHTVVV